LSRIPATEAELVKTITLIEKIFNCVEKRLSEIMRYLKRGRTKYIPPYSAAQALSLEEGKKQLKYDTDWAGRSSLVMHLVHRRYQVQIANNWDSGRAGRKVFLSSSTDMKELDK
jgi:hypothetical protein